MSPVFALLIGALALAVVYVIAGVVMLVRRVGVFERDGADEVRA